MRFIIPQKRELDLLIGKGHEKFGRVSERSKYRDEDEKGGGAGGFKTHPLFADMPEGASSDLTALPNQREDAMDEVQRRAHEANHELSLQPAVQQALNPGPGMAPPTPTPIR